MADTRDKKKHLRYLAVSEVEAAALLNDEGGSQQSPVMHRRKPSDSCTIQPQGTTKTRPDSRQPAPWWAHQLSLHLYHHIQKIQC